LDALKRRFYDGDAQAVQDIRTLLDGPPEVSISSALERLRGIVPSCMEWFGSSVSSFVSTELSRKLEQFYGGLYVEQEYEPGEDPLDVASQWSDLIEVLSRAPAQASDIEIEVALDEAQIRRLRDQRRAIPEKLAESIPEGTVKLGLDYAVPMKHLGELLQLYDRFLPQGKSYVFGHIGNAHLHAQMLPERKEEIEAFHGIQKKLAREVCSLGGSVSGEHGIGKIKHADLVLMLGQEGIEEICRIKKMMDPNGILNRGNMVKSDCYVDGQE
jgi:D-lactate dehydrogenase (cytochrome)